MLFVSLVWMRIRIRQVIGPRIPKQCLDNIDDASLDSAVPSGDWYTRDLFDKPGGADVVDDSYYCQLGAVAVLMGAKAVVTVIQESHTRILLRAGVLQAHKLIGAGGSRLDSETLSDVYIDDLIVSCCTEQMSVPLELSARLALVKGSPSENN